MSYIKGGSILSLHLRQLALPIPSCCRFLPNSSEDRRTSLREYSRLETEIARLRAAAEREIQLPRRVELNLEMKRRQAELTDSMRGLRLEGHK